MGESDSPKSKEEIELITCWHSSIDERTGKLAMVVSHYLVKEYSGNLYFFTMTRKGGDPWRE